MMSRRIRAISQVARLIRSSEYRKLLAKRLILGAGVHQTTTLTFADRYPDIFSEVARLLQPVGGPRILSFGCSTGEEVETVKGYVPNASIVGVDINTKCIRVCRERRIPDAAFFVSDDVDLGTQPPFDVIFCMAVLQRIPHFVIDKGLTDLSAIYKFSQFDEQISLLDRCLAPGGLLVIENSQYEFVDATVSLRYRRHDFERRDPPVMPKFSRDGRLMGQTTSSGVVFRKLS